MQPLDCKYSTVNYLYNIDRFAKLSHVFWLLCTELNYSFRIRFHKLCCELTELSWVRDFFTVLCAALHIRVKCVWWRPRLHSLRHFMTMWGRADGPQLSVLTRDE